MGGRFPPEWVAALVRNTQAVETFDGILSYSLVEKIEGRIVVGSELFYRLSRLIEDELVVEDDDNKVYLSEAVRRVLKGRALGALRD